jgi:hypothetical protein
MFRKLHNLFYTNSDRDKIYMKIVNVGDATFGHRLNARAPKEPSGNHRSGNQAKPGEGMKLASEDI